MDLGVNVNLFRRLENLFLASTSGRIADVGPAAACGSTKGPVRGDNQDRVFVAHIASRSVSDDILVGAVLDGMGGMDAGGTAASVAASAFILSLAASSGALAGRLTHAASEANDAVFARFGGRGGTTLTAVAFSTPVSGCAVHVGDSRLYRAIGGELELATVDDTVEGILREREGGIDEDDLGNQLIQFVGIGNDMAPHVLPIHDSEKALWLLTSDGAHGLGRRILQGIAAPNIAAASVVRRILTVADAVSVSDNASIVAMIPGLFQAPKRYDGEGVLSVWTPSTSLEIWESITGPRAPVTVQQSSQVAARDLSAEVELDKRQKPPEKSTKPSKAKSKAGNRKVSAKKLDVKQPNREEAAPQISIQFGSSKEPSND